MTDSLVERVAQIQEREQKTTPGNWVEHGTDVIVFQGPEIARLRCDGPWLESAERMRANRAFIAHAREDIPWLLAEVERLTRLYAEAINCATRERGVGIEREGAARFAEADQWVTSETLRSDLAAARERIQEVEAQATSLSTYAGKVTVKNQKATERITALSEALRKLRHCAHACVSPCPHTRQWEVIAGDALHGGRE